MANQNSGIRPEARLRRKARRFIPVLRDKPLALDKSTTYYAIYSADAGAGALQYFATYATNTHPYSGGAMIYGGSITPGYDTSFSARFATASAVPEPSTYAALAGLAAFVLVVWNRVRSARRVKAVGI